MKAPRIFRCAGLFFAGLCLGPAFAEPALQQDFPALHLGDFWTYERVELPQTDPAPGIIHVMADFLTKGGELTLTNRDPAAPSERALISGYARVSPDTCVVEALSSIVVLRGESCQKPLEPGATWSTEEKNANATIRLTFRFVGRETVTVPAGSFETWRFECDNRAITSNGEFRMERTFWYSPTVRGMVLVEDGDARDAANPRRWRMALRSFSATAPQAGPPGG